MADTQSATLVREGHQVGAVAIPELVDSAARGLVQMIDPATHIFCYSFTQTPEGMRREGVSHRYSIMTLLGLHGLELAGKASPIGIPETVDALLRDLGWVETAGDFGLLLWMCAVMAPERIDELCRKISLRGLTERYPDGRAGSTMEMAWLLTGIAQCALGGRLSTEMEAEGAVAFDLLKANCGTRGLFGHLARNRALKGRLRGRLGSFADQVYPIIALSKLTQASDDGRLRGSLAQAGAQARPMALRTGQAICDLQGPLGQWWWHYDSMSGRAVGKYPVYSVHQHAMGPMALFALGEATGRDYRQPILRGLEWIGGRNELNFDMRDRAHNIVWRSFFESKLRGYTNELLGVAGLSGRHKDFQIKYECRPYELGWLLFAFAGFAR